MKLFENFVGILIRTCGFACKKNEMEENKTKRICFACKKNETEENKARRISQRIPER